MACYGHSTLKELVFSAHWVKFFIKLQPYRERTATFGLRMQYCREKLLNSFDANETFYGVQFFLFERKVVCNISPVVSASRRNVSYNYVITQTENVKKKNFIG